MSEDRVTCRFCLRAHGPGATVCASCGAPLTGPEADAVARADVNPVETSAPAPGGEGPAEDDEAEPVVTGAAALAAAGLPVGAKDGEEAPVRRSKGGADPATMALLALGCVLIAGSMLRGRGGVTSSRGILPVAPPRPIAAPRDVAMAAGTTLAPTWMSARQDAVEFQPPLSWRTRRALFAFDAGHLVSMVSEANDTVALALHVTDRPAGDPVKAAADAFHRRMPEAQFEDAHRVRVGLNDGVELLGTSGDKKLLVVYAWNPRRAVHLAFLAVPGEFERWLPVFRASAATLVL